MRARFINESGISWSGKDVTKAPIIGKILTRRYDLGGGIVMEPEIIPVVEIVEDGDIYVTNRWYKQRAPLIVHKEMVNHFIPIDKYKDEDLESKFHKGKLRDLD
jgi:hypothetical protein